MRLSPNFTLAEFTKSATADKHKIKNRPTPEHLLTLVQTALQMELVRSILGDRVITVTSAYRNPEVNALVGGTATSAHPMGYAVDFHVRGLSLNEIMVALRDDKRLRFDQLIKETSRNVVHISFDPRYRRQVLTQSGGPGSKIRQGIV